MTADRPRPAPSARDETPEERADRNMIELLQELRVLVTGVQVLFAFLLTIAFTNRFSQLSETQRYVFVAALLMTVASLAVLAAPVAIHRGLFQRGAKEEIVTMSSRCVSVGLFLLSVSLDCAVFLVMDVVLGRVAASVITGCVAAAFLGLWFIFPWALRRL